MSTVNGYEIDEQLLNFSTGQSVFLQLSLLFKIWAQMQFSTEIVTKLSMFGRGGGYVSAQHSSHGENRFFNIIKHVARGKT